MRTGCALGAIVITMAACGSSPAALTSGRAVHPAAAHCGPRRAKTLAVDSQARVYRAHGVYGCARGGSRSYLLAGSSMRPGQPRLGKLALAGPVVAYSQTTTGVDTASAEVLVRRLDSGRTLRSLAAMSQPIGPESFQFVDSIVVKSNGSVAWIAVARSIIRHSTEAEVDRADRGGRSRLDTGSAIAPSSLRLSGSSLSWRHADVTRRARLA